MYAIRHCTLHCVHKKRTKQWCQFWGHPVSATLWTCLLMRYIQSRQSSLLTCVTTTQSTQSVKCRRRRSSWLRRCRVMLPMIIDHNNISCVYRVARRPGVKPIGSIHGAGLTIRDAQYQRKAGPFSYTRRQDFLRGWFSRCTLFFPQKVDDLFHSSRSNVQTSKQRGKNFAVDRGAGGGDPLPWHNRHNG